MERWADVVGYEGLYQVSDRGRVRSKDRLVCATNSMRFLKGRVLKQAENSRGYLRVQLVDMDGTKTNVFVHRLVAHHFVENPDAVNNIVVNHIDADPHNNSAENLEWTTQKENIHHAARLGRLDRTEGWLKNLRAYHERVGRGVIGKSLYTGDEIYFACLNDCKRLGFQPACVCHCCKGERKTHGGYTWRYAE